MTHRLDRKPGAGEPCIPTAEIVEFYERERKAALAEKIALQTLYKSGMVRPETEVLWSPADDPGNLSSEMFAQTLGGVAGREALLFRLSTFLVERSQRL